MNFNDSFLFFCLGMANLWVMVGFITKQDTTIQLLGWLIGCVIAMIIGTLDIKQRIDTLKLNTLKLKQRIDTQQERLKK